MAWGFAEVLPDKVTVLAETAERADEIDVSRAQEAKNRAEEQLKSGDPELNYPQVLNALQRAEARLNCVRFAPRANRYAGWLPSNRIRPFTHSTLPSPPTAITASCTRVSSC